MDSWLLTPRMQWTLSTYFQEKDTKGVKTSMTTFQKKQKGRQEYKKEKKGSHNKHAEKGVMYIPLEPLCKVEILVPVKEERFTDSIHFHHSTFPPIILL